MTKTRARCQGINGEGTFCSMKRIIKSAKLHASSRVEEAPFVVDDGLEQENVDDFVQSHFFSKIIIGLPRYVLQGLLFLRQAFSFLS